MKLFKNKEYKQSTFTYFIPAPPERNSGYREKHFDRLISEFLALGFEVLDIKTQSIASNRTQGMWVVFLVRATNDVANEMNFENFEEKFSHKLSNEVKAKIEIDGLYYIKDHNDDSL